MLIKTDLKDEDIVRCLGDSYGLIVEKIAFLPLGADFNTAVYRITTSSQTDYFLKLRRGEFTDAAVTVPKYLADLGIKQVIPPVVSRTGALWVNLASFKAILYFYIEGSNSVETKLSDAQWIEFGKTMKTFHSIQVPSAIACGIPRETFPSKWRDIVTVFLGRIAKEVFAEPVAAKMASFLKSKTSQIIKLIERAENLAVMIQQQPIEYILCHADIHGWNLMVDKANALYMVDWDTLIFAPKERDLMFIGAGISDSGRLPGAEEPLFYRGYGHTEINQIAICYYRCERIIQDIGEYCEHIVLSDEGDDDRIQSFEYLRSIFLKDGALDRAFQSDNISNYDRK